MPPRVELLDWDAARPLAAPIRFAVFVQEQKVPEESEIDDPLQPCTFRESLLRNSTLGLGYLLWLIPWIGWIALPLMAAVEFIMILGNKEGRRLGDEIAGTTVIEC